MIKGVQLSALSFTGVHHHDPTTSLTSWLSTKGVKYTVKWTNRLKSNTLTTSELILHPLALLP